jgi:hypothetical protein
VLRACTGRPVGSRALAVARVLGARQLLQAALTRGPAPSAAWLRMGAAVDAAHAASMIGLAAADRTLRRATLADAAAATAFASGGLAAARRAPRTARAARRARPGQQAASRSADRPADFTPTSGAAGQPG